MLAEEINIEGEVRKQQKTHSLKISLKTKVPKFHHLDEKLSTNKQ